MVYIMIFPACSNPISIFMMVAGFELRSLGNKLTDFFHCYYSAFPLPKRRNAYLVFLYAFPEITARVEIEGGLHQSSRRVMHGSQWPPGIEVATIFSEAIYTKLI